MEHIIEFENDKKLIFKRDNNPRNGFEVKFGDLDEITSTTLSKEERIELLVFLAETL